MEVEMPIIPETLRALRDKRGHSQQGLAERAEQIKGASVSKRTIARIESGEIRPEKVRTHTLESLAKALEVKPEALCKPVTEISDDEWKKRGYIPLKVLIRDDVRQNYQLVLHQYDVELQDLIDAAPWMFTLLAEMSLADRRRRLAEWNDAFDQAMDHLPSHLQHGCSAISDVERAYFDEDSSVSQRDIFGAKVLRDWDGTGPHPFDPDETNPFFEYLKNLADKLGSDEIGAKDAELPYGAGMPRWPVFQSWLHSLTGGDNWALFAVQNVKGTIQAMPEELKGKEKTDERVQWLIEQIPAEMKAREEERRAKWEAELAEITL